MAVNRRLLKYFSRKFSIRQLSKNNFQQISSSLYCPLFSTGARCTQGKTC